MRVCFVKKIFPYVLLEKNLGEHLKGKAVMNIITINNTKLDIQDAIIHEEQHVLHWYMISIPLIILISILSIYGILPISIAYIGILISILLYNVLCHISESIRLIAEIDCFRAENHYSETDRSKELGFILSNSYGFDISPQEAERRIRKGTKHAKKVHI